ncbi:hypothetical protein BpHYR1_037364 [Brachionus plicatilis]|uniref:Uncharacterized protein n=1 Tax=Brachionus plicatilis TaxID=10195 RepID=A0A3M7STZ9_BRAPC|nr:hypothetical protein BpHYR1_037364 [Brachionus plicatilis]
MFLWSSLVKEYTYNLKKFSFPRLLRMDLSPSSQPRKIEELIKLLILFCKKYNYLQSIRKEVVDVSKHCLSSVYERFKQCLRAAFKLLKQPTYLSFFSFSFYDFIPKEHKLGTEKLINKINLKKFNQLFINLIIKILINTFCTETILIAIYTKSCLKNAINNLVSYILVGIYNLAHISFNKSEYSNTLF